MGLCVCVCVCVCVRACVRACMCVCVCKPPTLNDILKVVIPVEEIPLTLVWRPHCIFKNHQTKVHLVQSLLNH